MNTETIHYLVYSAWNILDLVVIIRYMNHLYGKPKKHRVLFFVIALFIVPVTTVAMKPGQNYVNIMAITSMSFFLLMFYSHNIQKKILFSAIILTVAGFVTGISYFVFSILFDMESSFGFLAPFITHSIFWILLEIAPRLNKDDKGSIPYHLWLILLSIPIASVFVLWCLSGIFFASNLPNKQTANLGLPILLLLLCINFLVFFLFNRFSILSRTTTENALLTQQIAFQEKHYQQLESVHNRIQSIRHDVQNNLHTLSFLLERGEIQDLKEYLGALTDSITNVEQVISTQNPALDSVLNIKISEMQESNINVQSEIMIPHGLKISFEQAVILIGNIFDNAMEACIPLPKEKRIVQLKMSYASKMLFISLHNPFILPIKQNNGDFISTKEDGLLHGLGLKNVKKIADEFNGTIDTEIRNNEFTIKIVLYGI